MSEHRPTTGAAVTVTAGKVISRDAIEPVRWAVEAGRFLLRGEDTGSLFSFYELTTPSGHGPRPHIHPTVDETFYVIEGSYEIRVGQRVVAAEVGTLVYVPRGVVHSFRNIGTCDGRMLGVATPGGIEAMFEDLAELFSEGTPPDPARTAEVAAQHNVIYP
jgi:mannose-6-phosphate isomerase-like protein (cupin superfamily)